MEQREEKFIKKRNLTMKVLPEFLQMFTDSKELSSIPLINNCYRAKGKIPPAHQKHRNEKNEERGKGQNRIQQRGKQGSDLLERRYYS